MRREGAKPSTISHNTGFSETHLLVYQQGGENTSLPACLRSLVRTSGLSSKLSPRLSSINPAADPSPSDPCSVGDAQLPGSPARAAEACPVCEVFEVFFLDDQAQCFS